MKLFILTRDGKRFSACVAAHFQMLAMFNVKAEDVVAKGYRNRKRGGWIITETYEYTTGD